MPRAPGGRPYKPLCQPKMLRCKTARPATHAIRASPDRVLRPIYRLCTLVPDLTAQIQYCTACHARDEGLAGQGLTVNVINPGSGPGRAGTVLHGLPAGDCKGGAGGAAGGGGHGGAPFVPSLRGGATGGDFSRQQGAYSGAALRCAAISDAVPYDVLLCCDFVQILGRFTRLQLLNYYTGNYSVCSAILDLDVFLHSFPMHGSILILRL